MSFQSSDKVSTSKSRVVIILEHWFNICHFMSQKNEQYKTNKNNERNINAI